ncbi:hypothetical protein Sjap_021838 [Stephania japonica]|uniref:Uncharacterized protein n=1 Tax=Stephania japonica TaxID=461633 RepID=A0AAP0EN68_9MAGN
MVGVGDSWLGQSKELSCIGFKFLSLFVLAYYRYKVYLYNFMFGKNSSQHSHGNAVVGKLHNLLVNICVHSFAYRVVKLQGDLGASVRGKPYSCKWKTYFSTKFLASEEQIRVQLNELFAETTELLRIHGIHIPNTRRDHNIFVETEGDFYSVGEDEFEDDENYVNFDEPPKLVNDDQGFIEDKVVAFGDEGHIITVIPMSTSSQVKALVGNAAVNQCSIEVVAKKEVKFAATHFCSLTVDDVDFNEVFQGFLDHINLVGLESVIDEFILFPIIKIVKLGFEDKLIMDLKSREDGKDHNLLVVGVASFSDKGEQEEFVLDLLQEPSSFGKVPSNNVDSSKTNFLIGSYYGTQSPWYSCPVLGRRHRAVNTARNALRSVRMWIQSRNVVDDDINGWMVRQGSGRHNSQVENSEYRLR